MCCVCTPTTLAETRCFSPSLVTVVCLVIRDDCIYNYYKMPINGLRLCA